MCIKLSMKYTKEDLDKGKLKSLRLQIDSDGIVVIGCRAVDGLRTHYNNENFPILMHRDPLSYIWMKYT